MNLSKRAKILFTSLAACACFVCTNVSVAAWGEDEGEAETGAVECCERGSRISASHFMNPDEVLTTISKKRRAMLQIYYAGKLERLQSELSYRQHYFEARNVGEGVERGRFPCSYWLNSALPNENINSRYKWLGEILPAQEDSMIIVLPNKIDLLQKFGDEISDESYFKRHISDIVLNENNWEYVRCRGAFEYHWRCVKDPMSQELEWQCEKKPRQRFPSAREKEKLSSLTDYFSCCLR